MSSPDCSDRCRCGISRSSSAMTSSRSRSTSIESIDEIRSRFSSGTCRRICLVSMPEFRRARQIGAVAGEVDAGQHDLGMAALDQRAHLIDHRAHRHRARIAAAIGNDAEGAAMVAAVLHLHEHPRQAALKAVEQMRRHLLHRHDVGDRDLFARDAEAGASNAARASRQASPRILSSLPTTRSTSAMSANISACVCAAQPVTTMRARGARASSGGSIAAPAPPPRW